MDPLLIVQTTPMTTSLPYTFEPIEFGNSPYQLLPDFASVPFVNSLISGALTLWSMIDRLNFIAIIVVVLLALRIIWWLYEFVSGRPATETINLSGGLDTAGEITGDEAYTTAARATRKGTRFAKNPYRY
jgi:hypothetical protein